MTEINNGSGRVTRQEHNNHTLLIGLDRAGKRNAFDSAMLTDLACALGEYERNPQWRCAILFAHGEHFTAGLDLMELAPKLATGEFSYPEGSIDPFGVTKPRRTKPLIIALQGMCWTAAIEMALNADIALAADNARFAQLEVLRGIAPAGGATVRLTQRAGWSDAMRYMLTGDEFDASAALRMRLVSEVLTPESLMGRALELAETIAKAAPLGIAATLASANTARYQGDEAGLEMLNQQLFDVMKTKDVQEGVMAMLEKREPQFSGQ
jgi:enoyl-CoA hydratase/carnithine racemase